MVKILANGDIVADDDPRAQTGSTSGTRHERNSHVPQSQSGTEIQQGQNESIFSSLNQRLIAAGIPSFNVGSFVVEPIMLVGLILVLLFLGPQGLLFSALLFSVVRYSGLGGQGQRGRGGNRGNAVGSAAGQNGGRVDRRSGSSTSRDAAFSGSGHRLGQS